MSALYFQDGQYIYVMIHGKKACFKTLTSKFRYERTWIYWRRRLEACLFPMDHHIYFFICGVIVQVHLKFDILPSLKKITTSNWHRVLTWEFYVRHSYLMWFYVIMQNISNFDRNISCLFRLPLSHKSKRQEMLGSRLVHLKRRRQGLKFNEVGTSLMTTLYVIPVIALHSSHAAVC